MGEQALAMTIEQQQLKIGPAHRGQHAESLFGRQRPRERDLFVDGMARLVERGRQSRCWWHGDEFYARGRDQPTEAY
jgi:hypothetical protein